MVGGEYAMLLSSAATWASINVASQQINLNEDKADHRKVVPSKHSERQSRDLIRSERTPMDLKFSDYRSKIKQRQSR